jgi:hypothetical protein
MDNYEWLVRLGGQGYADVVKKINTFHNSEGILPGSLSELGSFSVLTDSDSVVFENRGKLERKLNKIQDSKLLFIKIHNKEDGKSFSNNNQLIYTNYSHELGECLKKIDSELGLYLINEDITKRVQNHVPRGFGTNNRRLYVRPKKIFGQLVAPVCSGPWITEYNHNGTLTLPFYQLEDVISTKEGILEDCKSQGVWKYNLKKLGKLFD